MFVHEVNILDKHILFWGNYWACMTITVQGKSTLFPSRGNDTLPGGFMLLLALTLIPRETKAAFYYLLQVVLIVPRM